MRTRTARRPLGRWSRAARRRWWRRRRAHGVPDASGAPGERGWRGVRGAGATIPDTERAGTPRPLAPAASAAVRASDRLLADADRVYQRCAICSAHAHCFFLADLLLVRPSGTPPDL